MRKPFVAIVMMIAVALGVQAADLTVKSPDGRIEVEISAVAGRPTYAVTCDGLQMLEPSALGLTADIGDFSTGMTITGHSVNTVDMSYKMSGTKTSSVHYRANELSVEMQNARRHKITVTFRVSDRDVAFRYSFPQYGETASMVIRSEATAFRLPAKTTTFICAQSDPMVGWQRTKPSYEESYKPDAPMTERSQYGRGYTFPCLFHVGEDGWVLVSETGTDGKYAGCHLSDYDPASGYTVALPMDGENNGNGTATVGMALPGHTPWRTITVGTTLAPIAETTVAYDLVEQRYEPSEQYRPGRYTWSWLVWQDNSINYDDQVKFIDLASAMGYEYCLVDNWWDRNIGRDRMAELSRYARSKGVSLMLWYNSNGYWNNAPQTPKQCMNTTLARRREMAWMKSIGVKGIKVDFFGGDKQQTMKLYEDILSDANDYGLMIIFHGCTLPRGWERMYPNYVGSEAVLASENLVFSQHFCDNEAFNATLHPFIRNAVGCMEFGGVFLNKRLNRANDGGTIRRTTDIFLLATAVLFQNPIQNFALAPNNLTDVPQICLDFMKQVPTTWDETRFIDGYPGRYIVLARRHGNTWYIAAANATVEPLKLKLDLPMLAGQEVSLYSDDRKMQPQLKLHKIKTDGSLQLTVRPQGGAVIVR